MVIQVNEETLSGALAAAAQARTGSASIPSIWERGGASLELELRTCMQR